MTTIDTTLEGLERFIGWQCEVCDSYHEAEYRSRGKFCRTCKQPLIGEHHIVIDDEKFDHEPDAYESFELVSERALSPDNVPSGDWITEDAFESSAVDVLLCPTQCEVAGPTDEIDVGERFRCAEHDEVFDDEDDAAEHVESEHS